MIEAHRLLFDTDASESAFAVGISRYLDAYPGQREAQPRIYVKFRPPGIADPLLALLDTGGHFCILNHEVVPLIRDQLTHRLDESVLHTARGPIRGELYILTLELIAERGANLIIDSTAFISPEWRAPNFLGYSGVLDRVRFAIDPRTNLFYFGSLR